MHVVKAGMSLMPSSGRDGSGMGIEGRRSQLRWRRRWCLKRYNSLVGKYGSTSVMERVINRRNEAE